MRQTSVANGDETSRVKAFRQRTPEWHAERRTGIGSSDAPVIAGVSTWGDIRTLYLDKLGIAAPVIETQPLRWGRLLEDAIAEGYTEITGNKLRRVNLIQRHPRIPFMLASLDRAIVGRRRILEIKTARWDKGWGEPGTDEIPEVYVVQVQHQMAVTGYKEADVAVLFGGSDLKLYSVTYDARLVEGLIELERAFWTCVTTRTPPPELPVERLEVRTDAVRADERITELAGRVRLLRSQYDAAKQARDEAEEQLKQTLGDRGMVEADDFQIIYRQNKDRVVVDWEPVARSYRTLLDDRPEIDAIESLYTRTKPGTRPLLLKWKEQDEI